MKKIILALTLASAFSALAHGTSVSNLPVRDLGQPSLA